jgi:hypothetical protein
MPGVALHLWTSVDLEDLSVQVQATSDGLSPPLASEAAKLSMDVNLGESKASSALGFETFASFDMPFGSDGRRLSAEEAAPEIVVGFAFDDEVAKVKLGDVKVIGGMPELLWNHAPSVLLGGRDSMPLGDMTPEPGEVTCAKLTRQFCVNTECASWRNATCVGGECVCGAGLCANDIGACVPYDGKEPAMLESNPCLSTEDEVALFAVKDFVGKPGADYDSCLILTPRSFVRFDYADWQGSLGEALPASRRLGREAAVEPETPVPRTTVKLQSQVSLPVVDTGRVGSSVEVATVAGEAVATIRDDEGSVLASRELREGPLCAETNVKLCVTGEPEAGTDRTVVLLDVCAATAPCATQVIAVLDKENRIYPKTNSKLSLDDAAEETLWDRARVRLRRVIGWRCLIGFAVFALLLAGLKLLSLAVELPHPCSVLLDFGKIGFHFKRVYLAKRALWFDGFPLSEDEQLFSNWSLDGNDCIAGYVAFRRSQSFVGMVLSAVAALMFVEGVLILQNDKATDIVGESAQYKDAGPGPLQDMLNDAEAIILVKWSIAIVKIVWPTISAIACFRCFSTWDSWKASDAAVLNCFALRIFLSAAMVVVPWFTIPLTDRHNQGISLDTPDVQGWRMIAAVLVNWPGISLCLGLTKALLRAIRTLGFVFPVTVFSRQMQIVAPIVAALFLWPVGSVLGHATRNVYLLYGFQLRLLTPCLMSIWAFIFQQGGLKAVTKSSAEEIHSQKKMIHGLKTKRESQKKNSKSEGTDTFERKRTRRSTGTHFNFLEKMQAKEDSAGSFGGKRSSVGMQLENITAGFYTNSATTLTAVAMRILHPISNLLLLYGIFTLANKDEIFDQGIAFLIDTALPLIFMFASDVIFLELVSTDVLVHCTGRLCIFNGFMDQDEDFHVLLKLLGWLEMTGRTQTGGLHNLRKSIHNPLLSSKMRHSVASVKDRKNSNTSSEEGDVTPRRPTAMLRRQNSIGAMLSPELTRQFAAQERDLENLTGCQKALEALCNEDLPPAERAEWIATLRKFEAALDPADEEDDDILHQL